MEIMESPVVDDVLSKETKNNKDAKRAGIAIAAIVFLPHLIGFIYGFLFSYFISIFELGNDGIAWGYILRVPVNWIAYFATYYIFIRTISENRFKNIMHVYLPAMIIAYIIAAPFSTSLLSALNLQYLIVNFIAAILALFLSRNYSNQVLKKDVNSSAS